MKKLTNPNSRSFEELNFTVYPKLISTTKCPHCGKNTQDNYDDNHSVCGWCMTLTYEIKKLKMIKYICIKTFVAENATFRRFYYGEDVMESLYLLLTQNEKNNFIKLTQ